MTRARDVANRTVANSSVDTAQLVADAVDNTILDLAGNYALSGTVSLTGLEYFQVALTSDQTGLTDNTANVIDFGGSGTVIHDTKSKVDTTNDAYEFDSSSGLYLINFSVGIRSNTVSTEQIQTAGAFLEFTANDFTSVFTGNTNQYGVASRPMDNASEEEGSHMYNGSFLFKTTQANTKVRMKAYCNTAGAANYVVESEFDGMLGTSVASGYRPTVLSIVRLG